MDQIKVYTVCLRLDSSISCIFFYWNIDIHICWQIIYVFICFLFVVISYYNDKNR